MALKQTTVTIKDTEFLITSFPATKGIKYLKQLTKLIGPSFAKMSKEGSSIGDALEVLFDNMDSVNVEELIKGMVVDGATKGSVAISFDMEFSAEYDKLFELVQKIVEHNFQGVFTLLGSNEQ